MSGPTFLQALSDAGGAQSAAMNGPTPGIVVSYDRVTQTCSATPGISLAKKTKTGVIERVAAPSLHNIPVIFPGSRGVSITWDLQAGDEVLLVVCGRAIDGWKATGGANTEPLDPRRFDLQDAVAIPGLRSRGNAIEAEGVAEGATVWLSNDIRLGSKDAASAVLIETLLPALQTVNTTLAAWAALSAPSPELTALLAALTALGAGITAGSYEAEKVKAE